jgi:hypothetical protein
MRKKGYERRGAHLVEGESEIMSALLLASKIFVLAFNTVWEPDVHTCVCHLLGQESFVASAQAAGSCACMGRYVADRQYH